MLYSKCIKFCTICVSCFPSRILIDEAPRKPMHLFFLALLHNFSSWKCWQNQQTRSSHCGALGLVVSLQCQNTGLILAWHSGLKDLGLPQCRSQLWLRSDLWPRNSICHGAAKKEKNTTTIQKNSPPQPKICIT